jgi:hypothetical protein
MMERMKMKRSWLRSWIPSFENEKNMKRQA